MKHLALALTLLALAGCCSVDHEAQAALAEQQIQALDKALAASDADLAADPATVRLLLEAERRSWVIERATALCEDELPK